MGPGINDMNQPATLSWRHIHVMGAAGLVLMITMGMRQTAGLYINPMMESTHLGYAAMSFALAVGQLMWGAAQPVFGAMAERYGPFRVLLIGALMLSLGYALTPFARSEWSVVTTFGVREDKVRESGDGFDGTWVAHPGLGPTALGPFDPVLGERPNRPGRPRGGVPPGRARLPRQRGRPRARGPRRGWAVSCPSSRR
jgi:hypothetical protein